MNSLIFLVVFHVSFFYYCDSTLTAAQRKEVLDVHNYYRRLIARGKVRGQPAAADMLEMKWSEAAAALAHKASKKCLFKHDSKHLRKFGNHDVVGQNIAQFTYKNMSRGIQLWFDEEKDYDFRDMKCKDEAVCGHYTQMIWAESRDLGCDYSKCDGETLLFCNYGPAGNWEDEHAYKEGTACSKCPKRTKCVDFLCR